MPAGESPRQLPRAANCTVLADSQMDSEQPQTRNAICVIEPELRKGNAVRNQRRSKRVRLASKLGGNSRGEYAMDRDRRDQTR